MNSDEYERRKQALQDYMDVALYGEENLHLVRANRAHEERRWQQISQRGLLYEDADYFAACGQYLEYLRGKHKHKLLVDAMRGAEGLRQLYRAARKVYGPWEAAFCAAAWRMGLVKEGQ